MPLHGGADYRQRSPREIAEELAEQGYVACTDTVRRIMTDVRGLSRRQAVKCEAGSDYEFRDEQFQHIAARRAWYERRGWPVISIDTKKKELLGEFFEASHRHPDCLAATPERACVTKASQLVLD